MVSSKYDCVFLQKFCVAPSPSRDFYALRVTGNQISLCIWRISHGRRHHPIEQKETLLEFINDSYMQDEVTRLFGQEIVRNVLDIAYGKGEYLPNLPLNILLKILSYLDLKDVTCFSQVCKKCEEVANNNELWAHLYAKYSKRVVTREETQKAKCYGWKKLFKLRKMHKTSKKPEKSVILSPALGKASLNNASTVFKSTFVNSHNCNVKDMKSQNPFKKEDKYKCQTSLPHFILFDNKIKKKNTSAHEEKRLNNNAQLQKCDRRFFQQNRPSSCNEIRTKISDIQKQVKTRENNLQEIACCIKKVKEQRTNTTTTNSSNNDKPSRLTSSKSVNIKMCRSELLVYSKI
ncbi:uncharacterized protein [Periplaneta americana]|uniref:uncharacterized protein n=1 Tax=Periplaneta americana TaxID=6978 RepID=UPI0037E84565